MKDTFFAARHKYEDNRRAAAGLNVKKAIQIAPQGKREPGIAICILGRPVLVLDLESAFRLASDLADKLTEQRAAK